jgi:hypothetical protein
MLASPAFLLLIAAGLDALWHQGCSRQRGGVTLPSSIFPLASCVVAAAGLLFVLVTSTASVANWFTDPAFSKADFRAVARYVREHIAPDETVTLTSGHLSPVWDYYAPDVERHRVPDIDILDVNATLGYHSASELTAALHGRRGVWTVLWQDDVVDPNGFLVDFLAQAGQEHPVSRTFWHVGLRHFRFSGDVRFSEQPPVEQSTRANFGGVVELLGWSQDRSGTVTLYWRSLAETARDLKVSMVLKDVQGHSWGRSDRRPAAYTYPTFRWQPGEALFGHYALPVEPGTPPGSSYRLSVGLYDETELAGVDVLDDVGNPLGKRVLLDGVQVPQLDSGDVLVWLLLQPGAQQLDASLNDELRLLGYRFDPAPLRPGEQRTLTTVWRASPGAPDFTVRTRWLDRSGIVLGEDAFMPGVQGQPGYPSSQWDGGEVVRSQATLFLPPDVAADQVALELIAFAEGIVAGQPLRLLEVAVEVPERVWEAPNVQIEIDAQFDFLVRLVGIDMAPEAVPPGGILPVSVIWQAVGSLASWDLTGFVHLLAEDGRVVAQEDHIPQRGLRPTRGWLEGEVVSDRYDLQLPASLQPGVYQLEIGLYLDDGTRLVVTRPQHWQGRDSVLAAAVRVE